MREFDNSSPNVDPQVFDIAIVGGGLVGASLAVALASLAANFGLRIAVIESSLPKVDSDTLQPSFDARSTALSYGSRRIYENIGIWQRLSDVATPIKKIHVSDKGAFGSAVLVAEDQDLEAFGYVLENVELGRVLLARLEELECVSLFAPAQLMHAAREADGHRLQIAGDNDEFVIDASLLVVADGGRSELCQKLNINRQSRSYDQAAVIANIVTDKPHENIAYERFTPQGPIALLPLYDRFSATQNRSALVLTIESEALELTQQMSDKEFTALVQSRFGYRLGQIRRMGARFSYPLALQQAHEQVRQGLVVLGNAAHTLHPVAGQGFNLALRGIDRLVSVLEASCVAGISPGQLSGLTAFREQQRADQQNTITFTEKLLKLFGNQDLLLGLARDIGLVGLDLVPIAKRHFARRAMGLKATVLS